MIFMMTYTTMNPSLPGMYCAVSKTPTKWFPILLRSDYLFEIVNPRLILQGRASGYETPH